MQRGYKSHAGHIRKLQIEAKDTGQAAGHGTAQVAQIIGSNSACHKPCNKGHNGILPKVLQWCVAQHLVAAKQTIIKMGKMGEGIVQESIH